MRFSSSFPFQSDRVTLISALYTELNENFFFDSSPIHATCTNSRAFSFDSSPLLISSSRVFTFDLSSLISSSPLPFITALTNIKVSNEAKHRSLTSENLDGHFHMFLKLNPLALIPILVDGDFILAESLAIIMVGPPTHAFNFPISLIYSYLYSIIHVLYVCSIWTISILNTLCCLMTFPKEHSIFRLHILFCRITSLRKKVGPHEKLPWAQSVIRKGFTGDTSLNTIKIYSGLLLPNQLFI
ncbi:hypothetical protein Ahy_A10g049316 [Arachis hypogaea]|uniref:Uncharacterized protein n=1 Tax=Arachis hypogaea TaxID=3818 RepID=A0A445B705_ARAHY|nr:hypothetical protein Ahy_A10g049316 [Arachis hypogaea]